MTQDVVDAISQVLPGQGLGVGCNASASSRALLNACATAFVTCAG
jgi:hypothetical protein